MPRTKSLNNVNLLSWISITLLITFVFTCFFIHHQYKKFQQDKKLLNQSYNTYKKDLLRSDVDWTISLIKAEQASAAHGNRDCQFPAVKTVFTKLKTVKTDCNNIIILDAKGDIMFTTQKADKINKLLSPAALKKILTKAKENSGGFFHSGQDVLADKPLYYAKMFGPSIFIIAELNDTSLVKAYGANPNRLKVDIIMETIFILILALLVIGGALRFSWSISHSQYKEIAYIAAFQKNALKGAEINCDNFRYREFQFIAESSVKLVEKIRELLTKLTDQTIRSAVISTSQSIAVDDIEHDMRHELKRLKVVSKSLKSGNLDERQLERINKINDSTRNIAGLLNNINFIMSNDELLSCSENNAFEFTRITEKILPRISKELKRKGIEFKLDIEENVSRFFFGDRLKITQILMNLIENAVQFTHKGYVKLLVSQYHDDEGTATLKLKVSDTGRGIPPDKIAFITDIANEDIANSENLTAASLKLSVCKNLLVPLNGSIAIESEMNKETSFIVTLPLEIAEEKDFDAEKKQLACLGRGKNVLIIESDPNNRDIEIFYFLNMGFSVDNASGKEDALAMLEKRKYDIILIDCAVNEYDGVEITKKIRESEKLSGEHSTIISLTSAEESHEWDIEMAAGIDNYILKPLNMESITEAIKKGGGEN